MVNVEDRAEIRCRDGPTQHTPKTIPLQNFIPQSQLNLALVFVFHATTRSRATPRHRSSRWLFHDSSSFRFRVASVGVHTLKEGNKGFGPSFPLVLIGAYRNGRRRLIHLAVFGL